MKRKKQEYHTHKRAYYQESQALNPSDVRSRTIVALDRLGHQVLSTEPGGYDLDDWLRSLDSLLEDFQEKLGSSAITEDFNRQIREALTPLTLPSEEGMADPEIERLSKEEAEATAALGDLKARTGEKVTSLKNERETCLKEIKVEREKLSQITKESESRGFFSRLRRPNVSPAPTEAKIRELESRLKKLEEELRAAQTNSGAAGARNPGEIEIREKLDAIGRRLEELQTAKQSRLQLSRERETATQRISAIVSSLRIEDGPAASSSAGVSKGP